MPLQLVLDLFPPVSRAERDGLPGRVAERGDVAPPLAYVVFDCETTGTSSVEDEIVSLALIRLDPDGVETERFTTPRPPVATDSRRSNGGARHRRRGRRAALCRSWRWRASSSAILDGAVFVAHNASFDLGMLQSAFTRDGITYEPAAVACTLEAFRLLDPLADNHRLQSICDRRGIELHDAHEAMSDVLATTALLRVLLDEGIAPETVELDHSAYMRLRSRGDTRPASEPQIRRVFGMARSAGLICLDGSADPEQVAALVERVTGTGDVDSLTRAQVQDVYDALEELIADEAVMAAAASA